MFRVGTKCFQMEKMSTKFEDAWNRYILLQRMKDLLSTGALTLTATVLEVTLRGCEEARRVRRRMNTVVCGVVANDLGLRFNVSASTILQKGEKVKVTVLDVVPDCLKIKAVMEGEWRVDDAPDYSKVL